MTEDTKQFEAEVKQRLNDPDHDTPEAKNFSLSLTAKDIGGKVFQAAITKFKQDQADKVIGQINSIMERVQVLTLLQNKTEKRLRLCENQLSAIEKGEFTIGPNPFARTKDPFIVFNDASLNVEWSSTEAW